MVHSMGIFKNLASLLIILGMVNPTEACTVFNISRDNQVLFGNIENEAPHHISYLHFVPANPDAFNFGHFYFYYNGNIAGGMNDQGLCFDVAALPSHTAYTGKPHGDLMDYLLTKCATLDDALRFFTHWYWPGHHVNHIMIMDKSGASAIVEVVGSTTYIHRKEVNAQVMTNYCIADPEIRLGDYPCSRFLKAHSMLDTMDIHVNNMQKVCEANSHAYYSAIYSSIYNPQSLEIFVFNANIAGSTRVKFDLQEELQKVAHQYMLKNNHIYLDVPSSPFSGFTVSQAFPNPFTSTTRFSLDLETAGHISIEIRDIYGNLLEVIEENYLQPGKHSYDWHSENYPAGSYLCGIKLDRQAVAVRRLIKTNY